MCYSLFMSLFTGSIAYTSVIVLWLRHATYRDRWNALWLFFLGSMQWYDAYIWYMHDNGEDLSTCSDTNWLVTRLALLTIMGEPVGQLCAYLYAAKQSIPIRTMLIYVFCFLVLPQVQRHLFSVWTDPQCGLTTNHCCSTITDGHHILYGYARDSSGVTHKCWSKYYFFGDLQEEIPLILRILFLLGIIYPYRYSNPLMPGLINATIIIASWLLGYYSDGHASVWCWGASLQSIYFVFFDAYLFPTGYDRKATAFAYHEVTTKEGKIGKKNSLKILQNRYSRSKIPKNLDAIVIGSGIGGLTTAALMARCGRRVLVLEQHYRAGGCMHTFDEFGGEFDSGIHYVGSIDRIKSLLSFITCNLVEWYAMGTKSDDVYDTIDLDGDAINVIQYRGGRERLMAELISKFPKSRANLEKYNSFLCATGSRITYLYILSKIFPHSFLFDENGRIYRMFVAPYMKYSRMTANEVISQYIVDPKLRAVIGGGQLIDWCLIPSRASWWVVAAMMGYYVDGAYYPQGGSNNIPQSIIPVITGAGGAVLCRARVKEILINNKSCAAYGVQMENGDMIRAPLIVSGVGIHTLCHELLPSQHGSKYAQELRILEDRRELVPSYGHMTAFITFEGRSDELNLPDYNIHSWGNLAQYDYDISRIQQLFYSDPIKYGDEALICLTFPSAKDPFYCVKFPNKSNALLLTEAKFEWFSEFDNNEYGKRSEAYKQFKEGFGDMFKKRLLKYCPQLADKIIDFEIGSPLSSEFFLNTYKGGSYGIAWNTPRFNHEYTKKFFHSHAFSAKIKNFVITGESSLFGGFIGALCSGYVTAIKVLGWRNMIKIALATTRVEE
eukprot:209080_1